MAAAGLRRARMEMRPEGGNAVGDAGSPCGDGADEAVPVILTESALCGARRGRSMMDDTRRCSRGFRRARAAPGGYGIKTKRKHCLWQEQILFGRDGNRRW